MELGIRRMFLGATAIATACLFGAVTVAGQAVPVPAPAAAPAQGPAQAVVMSQDVFKTATTLRGIPVDTFFESMGMFASAMGADCTFCHDKGAYFDKSMFAKLTPRMFMARQMMTMMEGINKQYFQGRKRVTCSTCHTGTNSPRKEPDLALQYGPPVEDANAMEFPVDTRVTPDQVFAKYLQAIGGADRLARFTSFAAKGLYSGFDTGFVKVPVELVGRAPAQQAMIVHMSAGDSTRTFDGGSGGWMAGPDTPLPLLTLTGGNLERARLEATMAFPAGLRQAFGQWRVGRTAIDGRDVQILQGTAAGLPPANLYFDASGLLVRMVRWTDTPVGMVPTQVDYADYRDVAGVKIPFKRTVSQTYMQMSVELSEMQPNVPVDAARFAKPVPSNVERMAPGA